MEEHSPRHYSAGHRRGRMEGLASDCPSESLLPVRQMCVNSYQ